MTSNIPGTQKNKLNINEWAEEDRPREKLLRLGATALSDAELLAILIGSGSTRESAVDLTRRILSDCNNNLNMLGKKQIADLVSYHGMGPAKAIAIVAACELGRGGGNQYAKSGLSWGRQRLFTTSCTLYCKTSMLRSFMFC